MNDYLSLPMYDIHRPDTAALLNALKSLLTTGARSEDALLPLFPDNLLSHWRDSRTLLSQTCGYPLMTLLPDVQTVGCFHYTAAGCEGAGYRSFLLVRQQDNSKTLKDFSTRRAVCNSPDSQSGYNVLRKMVAPLAQQGKFFSGVVFSGSHRQSLRALSDGDADIAAIDCVSLALLQRHQPALLQGLAVIEQSPLAPGLPLITSAHTSPQAIAELRAALQQLVREPRYQALCRALLIGGFSVVERQDYQLILDWQREAEEQGVTAL